MNHIADIVRTLASFAVVVAAMGSVGLGGAWLATRGAPCNPHGIGGGRCCDGCGG